MMTFKVSAQVRSLPSKTARPILGKSLSCHNVDDEVDLEDEVVHTSGTKHAICLLGFYVVSCNS